VLCGLCSVLRLGQVVRLSFTQHGHASTLTVWSLRRFRPVQCDEHFVRHIGHATREQDVARFGPDTACVEDEMEALLFTDDARGEEDIVHDALVEPSGLRLEFGLALGTDTFVTHFELAEVREL
jgi:hypothetical protein